MAYRKYDCYTAPTSPCCCCGGKDWIWLFEKGGFEFIRCTGCSLEKTDPIPSMEQIAAYYRSSGDDAAYETRINFDRQDSVYEHLVDWAIEQHGRLPERVLDVGCLHGILLDRFSEAGVETHGVELQKEASAMASLKHGGRVFNGTVEDYVAQYGQTGFDLITSIAVIEHVPDPAAFVASCRKLMSPGATLILQTPNTSSRLHHIAGKHWPPYVPVEHIHYFGELSLPALLSRHRLETRAVKAHWKRLELDYFHCQTRIFIPMMYQILNPVWKFAPGFIKRAKMPMYTGEMLLSAKAA